MFNSSDMWCFVPSCHTKGRVGQGQHEGHPGDRDARDHAQPAGEGESRFAAEVLPPHHWGEARGRGTLHVSAQHEPDAKSGKKPNFIHIAGNILKREIFKIRGDLISSEK